MTSTPRPDADPQSPEDPNRFPREPGVAPLDEAPDGQTPSDPTESEDDSLPPGAPHRTD
jgi:hypothetical protein